MSDGLVIKNGIIIPEHELDITASRAGGPGGQHVQKTSSRVTVRWNVRNTSALTDEQKQRVVLNLASRLTTEGDLIIHNSESRSQHHNKKRALEQLANTVSKALFVPKKRMKTRISSAVKEARMQEKARRSAVKKLRGKVESD